MSAKNNLKGNKYNRLTVIEDSGQRVKGDILWRCRCDCGNEKLVLGYHLKNGAVQSCGCLHKDSAQRRGQLNGETHVYTLSPKLCKRNTSGYKGVHWDKRNEIWIAEIGFGGKHYKLCSSKDINDCVQERANAEDAIRGNCFEAYMMRLRGISI